MRRTRLRSRAGGAGGALLDYYVDSVNGSDSNDGRTAATAFQTLSAVNAHAANGLRVGLARGSKWEEELQWSAYTGVYVVGYGDPEEPMPHVECSGTANNASFSLAAAKTNTYEISWAHTVPNTNAYIQVWENGTPLTYVTSAAAVEGTPGSFYASSATTPATVSVHPTGSTNPTTDGKLYEISKRSFAIDLGTGGALIGIWGSRNGHPDGSLRASYVVECLGTEGLKHNIWVRVGGVGLRSVAYKTLDPTNRATGTMFVTFETAGSTQETVYQDCVAYGLNYSGMQGFYSHTAGGAARLAKVRHIRPRGFGLTNFIASGDTDELVVEGAFGEKVGELASGATLIRVDNATCIIDAASGQAAGTQGRAFAGYGRLEANEVRVYLERSTNGGLCFPSKDGDIITNSSFYGGTNNNTKAVTFNASGTAVDVTVNNVIMYNFNFIHWLADTGSTLTADNNVFYRIASALTAIVAGTTYNSWAAYRAALPAIDANSVNLDPQFSGNPQLGDFRLNPASPAYTDGRNSGSQEHIERPDWATLTAAWDAGFIGI